MIKNFMCKRISHFLFVACMGFLPSLADAQDKYPSRPIKIVVGSEAGSAPDILARAISVEMGATLGQSVIVENKAGATGTIGASYVVSSASDGYTLLMGTVSNIALAPAFYPVKYDPVKSFAHIAMVASVPLVLVASNASGMQNLAQITTKAKAEAGTMNFASPGIGGPQHLAGVLLQKSIGSSLLHIPYKSGGAAMTAVASGEVQLAFAGIPAAAGLIKGNKVRPIFVTTSKRSSALSDVPTSAESGLAGFEIDNWHGIFAPTGISIEVRVLLEQAIQKSLNSVSLKEQFLKVGAEPMFLPNKQLEAYVTSETLRWSKVITENKIKAE